VQQLTKNGVSPSCIALPKGEWSTVVDFLADQFPHIPKTEWIARMQRGDVLDEQGISVVPGQAYQAHSKIYYYRNLSSELHIPFEEVVLYQDEYLVVADKPHFLPVTPGGRYLQETLLVRLKQKLKIDTLTPMHRIDRETAGLVLFAIQPNTRDRYQALFRDRMITKHYEAIAPWRPELTLPMTYRSRLVEAESFMRMREAAGEPNAETSIDLIEIQGNLARYSLCPDTGKKHQLRVHMAALAMPILNDQIYPVHYPEFIESSENTEPDYSKPLQLLAKSLAFNDPVTGEQRQFTSCRTLMF
jgi:tRNA pseudouridine32 synthase / 23S rRNA pseudouridine746 synthase